MNPLFLKALKLEPQKTPPIWMMRQAGRYHSHYQNLRKKHSFIELCKVPELAAEVALGPVREFDFDVSILFSDLLFPLEALGLGLTYEPGPKLGWHLNPSNISKMKSVEEALPHLMFQSDAVKATRDLLPQSKSLIGFVGGPFTLFAYAVDGGHKGSLVLTKKYLSMFDEFCKKMVPLLIENIKIQAAAGAEVVMILDTAAGELSAELFHRFVLPPLAKVISSVGCKVGYYSKGIATAHLNHEFFRKNKPANLLALGLDHSWDMPSVLAGDRSYAVQGNLDQALLHCDSSDFSVHLDRWLSPILDLDINQRRGWICGLGHGILPETPEANVKKFIEVVRSRCK
jgi:uroporphyrinogen decarboxylase